MTHRLQQPAEVLSAATPPTYSPTSPRGELRFVGN